MPSSLWRVESLAFAYEALDERLQSGDGITVEARRDKVKDRVVWSVVRVLVAACEPASALFQDGLHAQVH